MRFSRSFSNRFTRAFSNGFAGAFGSLFQNWYQWITFKPSDIEEQQDGTWAYKDRGTGGNPLQIGGTQVATFDGVAALQAPVDLELYGITIVNFIGTSTPTISGNTITLTAGTLEYMELSNGDKYYAQAGNGVELYSAGKKYSVFVRADGDGIVAPSSSTYDEGTVLTLTTTPIDPENTEFDYYQIGKIFIGDNPYNYVVESDAEIIGFLKSSLYSLLNNTIFTTSNGWTLAASAGSISEIAVDPQDGISKLHIERSDILPGNYAVAFKTNIFSIGDVLRLTIDINIIGGSSAFIALGDGNATEIIKEITGSGIVIFDNIDTSICTDTFIIIYGKDTITEFYVASLKVEKKGTNIERYNPVFNNSVTLSIEPNYNIRNAFSEFEFYTTDTSITIQADSTIKSLFPQYAQIAVFEDDVYSGVYLITDKNDVEITLSAGNKKVTLVEGLTTMPITDMLGTYLTSIKAENFTKNNQGNVDTKCCFIGDSITVGGNSSIPQKEAFGRLFKIENSKEVAILGYGYATLKDFAETQLLVDNTVTDLLNLLSNSSEKKLVIALGTNDYGLDSTPPATFAEWYANFVDSIHASDNSMEIYCISPLRRSGDPTLLANYRIEIETICSSRSYTTYINGYDILLLTDLVDGVHPTTAGHKKYKDAIYNIIYP